MRYKFEEQLKLLNDELIEMGDLIESAIANAVKALESKDLEYAKKAIAFDDEVDRKEKDIEAICLKLILHQQPVATDLRMISAALKMITDMERIGDMASDIAEIAETLSDNNYIGGLTHIHDMAAATITMVNESVDAYINKDTAMAKKVIDSDDIVDNLFDEVKNDLVELIGRDAKNGEAALDFLMVAKYFERIGDHATNIAEWVMFSITGGREPQK